MLSENDKSADNQQESNISKYSDDYFLGFVEGEGCFYVGFSKRDDLILGWQVITEFHLSQNPGGKEILKAFSKRLGCGYLKKNHPKSLQDRSWVLIVKDRKDLTNKLIPFFKKNKLRSSKYKEFSVFCKVLQIIEQKKHLKPNGFVNIVNLVFSLDRKTNKKYSKEYILRSSETIRRTLTNT